MNIKVNTGKMLYETPKRHQNNKMSSQTFIIKLILNCCRIACFDEIINIVINSTICLALILNTLINFLRFSLMSFPEIRKIFWNGGYTPLSYNTKAISGTHIKLPTLIFSKIKEFIFRQTCLQP